MTNLNTAAIRERATYATAARNDIHRCEFMRVIPALHSHRQVAASQADVPDLLDEVERLRATIEHVRAITDECGEPWDGDAFNLWSDIRAALTGDPLASGRRP
ncbi:hypothetical protein GS500_04585 [Rhodococcus hoagii]|nr:hypothetical protein [Prescottella equi]